MGQQQLLLLVIGIVIVALAVMAAFPVLDRGFKQDEADGLLDRSLAVATQAAAWRSKNQWYGGNGSYQRLASGGMGALALDSTNVRGRFSITAATATRLQVTGVSTRYPGVGVRVFLNDYRVDSTQVRFNGTITLP